MREEFRRNPPINLSKTQRGAVEGDFAACISLYHAYELLLQHGMRAFFNFISKVRQISKTWLFCLPNHKSVRIEIAMNKASPIIKLVKLEF